MKLFCAKCGAQLRVVRMGIPVIEYTIFHENGEPVESPYCVTNGDLFGCPGCPEASIVIGNFGRTIYHHDKEWEQAWRGASTHPGRIENHLRQSNGKLEELAAKIPY